MSSYIKKILKKAEDFILNTGFLADWILPVLMTFSALFWNFDQNKINVINNIYLKDFLNFISPRSGWILAFSCILYLTYKGVEARAKPRLKKTQKDLKEAKEKNSIISGQVRNLFDGYLYSLSTSLNFGIQDKNNERISLYIYDGKDSFIPCGRFSANPSYKQSKRQSYPEGEGCIAKGWENGWHFDNRFPNPERTKEYIDYCMNTYKVPRNTTRRINMKSSLYAVMSIKNNGDLYGVIVVESTHKDRFKEQELKKILETQNNYLAESIKQLKEFIPTPKNASDRGL